MNGSDAYVGQRVSMFEEMSGDWLTGSIVQLGSSQAKVQFDDMLDQSVVPFTRLGPVTNPADLEPLRDNPLWGMF